MNPDQKRHLAATLSLIEKDLRREEQLLQTRGEKGILYEILDTLHEEQRQKALKTLAGA
jgi:hypothetical protein